MRCRVPNFFIMRLHLPAATLVLLLSLGGLTRASTFVATRLVTFGSSGTGNGQFNFPAALAVNQTSGLVYVADSANHRIQVFTSTGTFVSQFGGMGMGVGQFSNPAGVAVNQVNGDIYVADSGNNRIQRFSKLGVYIGQWGMAGNGLGQFEGPTGIAIRPSNGDVYVGEFNGDRVQYFDRTGVYKGVFVGATFQSPGALAFDPKSGNVYVTEYNGKRVQSFTPSGTLVASWKMKGDLELSQPAGVAVDDSGRVIVTDRKTPIPIFDAKGTLIEGFSDDSTNTNPYGLAVGGSGLVYVSDGDANSVSSWQFSTINKLPAVAVGGKPRIKTSRGNVRLHGTASDPDGTISRVAVKIGKKTVTAVGTTSWSYKARLRPGRNVIFVTATDSDGGVSPAARVIVIRK